MRTLVRFATAAALMLAAAACHDQALIPDAPQAPPGPERLPQEMRKGWILRDGVPVEVTFEVRDGRGIYEGDIDLGPAAEIPATAAELQKIRTSPGGPRYGVVTSDASRRWSNGVVPYVIESNVPNPSRITAAISHIEQKAPGLDFVPRTNQGSWIIFRRTTDPDFCGLSPLGRQGGGQVVYIRDDCSTATAIHEILHSLGYWHEQSRCDRDTYVEILWGNVESGRENQFALHCGTASTIFAYDETSIMHYHRWAFGKVVNGVQLQTIRSRRGLDHLIGTGTVLSTADVQSVNWAYAPPFFVSVAYPGGTPTLGWQPYLGATQYEVYLVLEEEVDDAELGYSRTVRRELVGTTSGTSMTHAGYTFTDVDTCYQYDWLRSESRTYWYEVKAVTSNVEEGFQIGRQAALIAEC